MKIKIDTPAWSFTKYNDDGSVDYRSPIPCPFNYGSVLGTEAEDGDRLDAVLLGERQDKGVEVDSREVGVVRFVDAGENDDKVIFSSKKVSVLQRIELYLFFRLFSLLKWAINKLKGKKGHTGFVKLIINPLPSRYK